MEGNFSPPEVEIRLPSETGLKKRKRHMTGSKSFVHPSFSVAAKYLIRSFVFF